jgi:hypothetical protein
MKAQVNDRTLAWIAATLAAGQPLWAILTANEYFQPDSDIRCAFATRAKASIKADPLYSKIGDTVAAILEGHTLNQLNSKAQRQIRALPEKQFRSPKSPMKKSSFAVRRRRLQELRAA